MGMKNKKTGWHRREREEKVTAEQRKNKRIEGGETAVDGSDSPLVKPHQARAAGKEKAVVSGSLDALKTGSVCTMLSVRAFKTSSNYSGNNLSPA